MGGIVSTRDGQHAGTQSDSTSASSQRAAAESRDGGPLANGDRIAKPAVQTEPMTLAQRVREAFGLEDRPDRPGLIPLVPTEEGLIASRWLYDLAKAVALPKHVMSGGTWTPEDVTHAALAIGAGGLVAQGTGMARNAAKAAAHHANAAASRSPRMYNPPAKSQRSFDEDYSAGARTDDAGNLTHDIDGNPLQAERVVGRRVVGGDDKALPEEELKPLGEALTGREPARVQRVEGGGAGRYAKAEDRRTVLTRDGKSVPADMSGDGWLRYIQIDKDLDAQSAIRVLAHEVGHAIADRAGSVVRYVNDVPFRVPPMDGLDRQLRVIYNDLNNPVLAQRRANAGGKDVDISTSRNLRSYAPEDRGYPKKEVADELWAEAIRAYMADPNYLKIVAPDVAATIRKAVNANPSIKTIIQFNSAGASMASGLHGFSMAMDEE